MAEASIVIFVSSASLLGYLRVSVIHSVFFVYTIEFYLSSRIRALKQHYHYMKLIFKLSVEAVHLFIL